MLQWKYIWNTIDRDIPIKQYPTPNFWSKRRYLNGHASPVIGTWFRSYVPAVIEPVLLRHIEQ